MKKYILCVCVSLFMLFNSICYASAPVVETDLGRVQGVSSDGIGIFKGIPFAAPPVGDLRWRAPQAAESWKGIRLCDEFGAVPLQPDKPQRVPVDAFQSEDCLYLNVWTPDLTPKKPLPVMVWIFGGAFRGGAGSNPEYDGMNFAKRGVVLVTFNYRLGIFGFYVHDDLAAETGEAHAGNYALLDQIAALKWVKRNIAAFGGDPHNVTIFGESAGAASVSFLYTSPLATGLFARAIAESGSVLGDLAVCPDANGSWTQAAATGKEVIRRLGLSSVKDIRLAPADRLLSLEPELTFAPVIDGWVVPGPGQMAFDDLPNRVPLMTGTNSDEGGPFCDSKAGTLKAYRDWLGRYYGDRAEDVFNRFPASDDVEAARVHPFVSTLTAFTAPARFQIQKAGVFVPDTYLYYFDYVPPTEMGRKMGSYHTAEIPYVFGNLPEKDGYGEKDRVLSHSIQSRWVNFAKTGNPNGEKTTPEWPVYREKTEKVLYIHDDASISVEDHPYPSECDFIIEAIPVLK